MYNVSLSEEYQDTFKQKTNASRKGTCSLSVSETDQRVQKVQEHSGFI